MANPNESAAPQKTPAYAWPCLIVSLLVAVAMVYGWQWLPGVTFPAFKEYMFANNPVFQANPAMAAQLSNIMGLVPIGAMIMAFPTTWIVKKIGAKWTTVLGVAIGAVSCAVCAICVTSGWELFLVMRFVFGLGLATCIVAGPTCVSIWFPNTTRGRAMAIWSMWAGLGIFTINCFGGGLLGICGGDMVVFLWVITAIIAICCVIFIVVFRDPRADEVSQVSPERKPIKEILPFFKSRQLWCLIIMFMIFNYMNYFFSTYLKTWLATPLDQGGYGWDPAMAGLLGGLICACGVLGPIGGFVLDKLSPKMKWITCTIGICGLTIASATAFIANAPAFAVYVVFFCIGNMFLNGVCRPLVPTFVFKGGATAVALGLSCLTFCQYLGQIPTAYVYMWGEAAGMTINEICLVGLVPIGVIGILFSFGVMPSRKSKSGDAAGAPAGKPSDAPAEAK